MKKIINRIIYITYSILCFGVAGYAYYFLFQPVNPDNGFQAKLLESGLEVPIHFFAGGLALFLVPFQLSKKIRRASIITHRYIGYLYTLSILFAGCAGLIMATNATGGVMSMMGFGLLAIVWLFTTFKAVRHALNGEIKLHKKWIYRSIAVTSAAITLRLFLGLGLGVLQLPFLTVYVPTSWLCWIVNLIICEIILVSQQKNQKLVAVS